MEPGAVRPADHAALGASSVAGQDPRGYPPGTTFHPTFLYESLWNFFLCGALLWIDKHYRPRGAQLFAMYVAGYTFMRFWIEGLRIDPAHKIDGWRVNQWVSLVLFVIAVVYLVVSYVRPRPATAEVTAGSSESEMEAGESVDAGVSVDTGESVESVDADASVDVDTAESVDADASVESVAAVEPVDTVE